MEDGLVTVTEQLRMAAGLRRAFREAQVVLHRALSARHLSALEYHLLLDLACADEGLGQSELVQHLQAPKTRVSVLVRGLEQRGLVEPFRPPENRRQVRVRLTADGLRLLQDANLAMRQAVAEMVRALPHDQLVQLLEGAVQSYLGLDVTIVVGSTQPAPPTPPGGPHQGPPEPAGAAPPTGVV
ncbi:MAG: MarR family transcriptional regulator [Candidatus Dormibacteraeota bacterium]|nr:MarR family transcriptional regulator [Candidatus Dormibacteraeota bacterium]MBO0761439.1 MarR family transcriptional regulator [Candidatus Dormibacteraeota bacterium]